jgi:hypothetical protein
MQIMPGREVDEQIAKYAGVIFKSNDAHLGRGLSHGQATPDEAAQERNWRAKLLEYQVNDMSYPFVEAALAGAKGVLALNEIAKEAA